MTTIGIDVGAKTLVVAIDPAYDRQYHATRSLLSDANVLLQPGGAAQQIIQNYYVRCQNEQNKAK